MQDPNQCPGELPEDPTQPEPASGEPDVVDRGFDWVGMIALAVFGVLGLMLVVPILQSNRVPAPRSAYLESQQRLLEIEQAARDATSEHDDLR